MHMLIYVCMVFGGRRYRELVNGLPEFSPLLDAELLATEDHGCVRAFNGYRPPSRLAKGGRNEDGTWCLLAFCLTRCVLYQFMA